MGQPKSPFEQALKALGSDSCWAVDSSFFGKRALKAPPRPTSGLRPCAGAMRTKPRYARQVLLASDSDSRCFECVSGFDSSFFWGKRALKAPPPKTGRQQLTLLGGAFSKEALIKTSTERSINNSVSLYPLTALALAACGGGGGGSSPAPPEPSGGGGTEPLTGRVYDGPIVGAQIYFDVNENGVQDDGDVQVATTDALGSYTISAQDVAAYGVDTPLLAVLDGATDIGDVDDPNDSTPASGTWQTPAGSSVISPLTDFLVKAEIDSEDVAELLGLPEGVDVTQYDPYESGVDDETALAVIEAGQAVAEVLAELDTTDTEVTADVIKTAVEEAFDDEPPTAFTLANEVNTLAEDTDTTERVKIADLVVTDADTDSAEQAYILTSTNEGEADEDLFEVEGAALYLIAGASLDFERALELGGSTLDVTVTVAGTRPPLTQTHTITLTDVDEAPTDILFTNVIAELPENSAAQKLADITFEDVDGGNNAVTVDDNTIFEIRTDPTTGGLELWLKAGVLDFGTATTHTVTLQATTNSELTQDFTLTVTENAAPVLSQTGTTQTIELREDATFTSDTPTGYTFTAPDANGDDVRYLVTGDLQNRFTIDDNGVLSIVTGSTFDYEASTNLNGEIRLVVTATDGALNSAPLAVDIQITDVDEPPTGIGFAIPDTTTITEVDATTVSLAEDVDIPSNPTTGGIKLADITFTDDALGTARNGVQITEDSAGLFVLRTSTDGDTELWLKPGAMLDYEMPPNSYTVKLQATWDDADVDDVEATFTLTITDVNEAPVLEVSGTPETQNVLEEGMTPATLTDTERETSYTVMAMDPEGDTVTFAITRTGTNVVDPRFEIVSGALRIKTSQTFDYEDAANPEGRIPLTITATDTNGLSNTAQVTIIITNVPSAPTISVSGSQMLTLNEGTTAYSAADNSDRQTGYSFTAEDTEDGDTVTFSVSDPRFEIVGGKLLVKTGKVFDYETTAPNADGDPSGKITLTITATDNSPEMLTATQDVTITVVDVISDPTITVGGSMQTLTLNEGTTDYSALTDTAAPTGHTFTATDEDDNAATLSVEDDDRFEIVIGSGVGVLRIKTGQMFDYEDPANPSGIVTVVVAATDANGRVASTSVTIQITNVNEAPVLTVVSPVTQEELLEGTVGAANIATGYTVTAPDEDDGDTVTFTITGTGTNVVDTRFAVVNDELVAVAGSTFDHETEETIRLTIIASDGRLSSNTETVEIIITNDPSAPVISVSGSQMLTLEEGTTVYSAADNSDRETGFSFTAEDVEDGDTVTLSVNDDRFEIAAAGGPLLVKTGQTFDYEATAPNADGDPSGDLTLTITATDSDGQVTEKSVTIALTDVTFSTVLTDVGDFYDFFDFTPAFGHFDSDSVVDFLLGDAAGFLNHFSWDGTDWSDQTFLVLPFPFPLNLNFGETSAPAFGDVDGDGDDDLLVGAEDGILNYLRWGDGEGTEGSTGWTVLTDDTQNPFNSINFGSFSAPTFGDVDGDGDDDLLVGNDDGFLTYYRWDGTRWHADEPNNPFDGINFGFDVKPTFGDVDGDGDDDLLVGAEDGMLTFYRWGRADDNDPNQTPATGWSDQTSELPTELSGNVVYGWSAPAFGDVDGDGDDDLVVGGFSTLNIWYWNEDDTWSTTSDII